MKFEKDELEESRITKGKLMLEFKVGGHGIQGYPPTYGMNPPDAIEMNGYATVELDMEQVQKLKMAIDDYLTTEGHPNGQNSPKEKNTED